jgi:hypothetical protein
MAAKNFVQKLNQSPSLPQPLGISYFNHNILLAFVGNKSDMKSIQRRVSSELACSFAQIYGLPFFETRFVKESY